MESFPADLILQAIAAENNLSETAFLMRQGSDYRLRPRHPRECGRGYGAIGPGPQSGDLPLGERSSHRKAGGHELRYGFSGPSIEADLTTARPRRSGRSSPRNYR
jgi:hypothetical protein